MCNMSSYDTVKLDISPDQHEKLKHAAENGKSVSMRVNISKKAGRHTFLLTHSQRNRLERAKLMKKANVIIKLSRKQIKANAEHRGGFIGTLLGLASKVLPTLLGGLATGLISGGIEKAVTGRGFQSSNGNGLYLYKSGRGTKITPIKGGGARLMPTRKKLKGVEGDGLFLKHGSRIHDGRGLLLGKNSPFKNIPLLGLLL